MKATLISTFYSLYSDDSRHAISAIDLTKVDSQSMHLFSNTVRSAINDDTVNFSVYELTQENQNYWALTSDDRRVGQVLLILDGECPNEDISNNEFFIQILSGLENYIGNTEDLWDSTVNNNRSVYKDLVEEGGWSYSSWVRNSGNSTHEIQTKWNQNNSPFNDCLKTISKGNAIYTGCGAVQVAQLMAYYEYPKNWKSPNYTVIKNNWSYAADWDGVYDWQLLKSRAPYTASYWRSDFTELEMQLSALMYDIAVGCNSTYTSKGTSTTANNRLSFLNSIGYIYDNETDYNFTKLQKSIDSGYVVPMRGYSRKEVTTTTTTHKFLWWKWTTSNSSTSYKNGHAWIADGYYNMSCVASKKGKDDVLITENFVHCNPGWGSSNIGYYISGVFDMRDSNFIANDEEIDSKSRTVAISDAGTYNYEYGVKQINSLRVKK